MITDENLKKLEELAALAMPARIDDVVRVTTSNDLVWRLAKINLSLNARKLLYAAIAQCEKGDKGFYVYGVSVSELATFLGAEIGSIQKYLRNSSGGDEKGNAGNRNNILDELLNAKTEKMDEDGSYVKINADFVKVAAYDARRQKVYLLLHPSLTNDLLNLENKGNFSKPLLMDFGKMNSEYGPLLWHWIQVKCGSRKPSKGETIIVEDSLQNLCNAIGIGNYGGTTGNFKSNIIQPAVRDIENCCGVNIMIENLKEGRIVSGYRFLITDSVKVPKKAKKYFKDEELNKKFIDYLEWWTGEFGKMPTQRTVYNWKKELIDLSEGNPEIAIDILKATENAVLRRFIVPKNAGKKQDGESVKKETKEKTTKFNGFNQREYTKEFFDKVENVLINK